MRIRTEDFPRPLCSCGRPVEYQGTTLNGFKIWKSGCRICRYEAKKHLKNYCEKCGSNKKLQIDHIDGDRGNNKLNNLRTLCHPCHIDETTIQQQWKRKNNEKMHGLY